ncbi:PAAR domain-containing protein [Ralstonia sp.]|uniref:PAAR domain-containing protein n=1 Tax=Ralstonia sp. TaxID=54061 RepID=UPI002CA41998|nr:PAAR domain-containing protein [Ralstonia sp.]HWV02915.1 PAAR domain-containing protein [Ralstonia sp.]
MSAEIIRVGDPTDHGGVVLDGIPGTDLYGLPIAGIGNMVMCPKCHGPFPIIEGAANYEVNGVKVALRGMKTACGAVLIAGNPRTQVRG